MPLDRQRCRPLLREFRLRDLFVDELGWDRHAQSLEVIVDGRTYQLSAIAEKAHFVAFECPDCDDLIGNSGTRRKLETQVAKPVREHLIIYTDAARTTQIWQWVKREIGRPAACREHIYRPTQPGDSLLQKLEHLVFTLEDEERGVTVVDSARRVRRGFDVERITRRFYDRFKSEHTAFLKFLKGIPDEDMQRWYVSVMLNRLMFIYFIQKKGFLDGDRDYLRNKLAESKRRGRNHFYRDFLCPLFFDGFAKRESDRSEETNQLLGDVPYLNGGIFMRHQIEELHGEAIQIADSAFEKLFAFFDAYQWHLDERLLRADNEINPDVLGYIFEKYINQKQMGAYYTKEDITGYISQNTVIPYLFDVARRECKVAFEGESSVWQLLQEDPDQYLYEAVRRGVIDEDGEVISESVLPDFVQAGMHDPKARMFDRRYNLGDAFIPDAQGTNLALPTETWREYICRRQRCLELREKLKAGEITEINDLITYNLDIRQFAQDVIQSAETPDRLLAFWRAIAGRAPQRSNEEPRPGITVLDPTCGSGAFLFAALNILEPLYTACLERMEAFVEDSKREKRKRWSRLREEMAKVLARMEEHPNQRYFVLKSIIISNLYGVDIMEEAVEICKLRLFLKLVAQIDDPGKIEPLPDIDFNIQAGNTLVGFATREGVKAAITTAKHGQAKLLYGETQDTMQRIEENAEKVDSLFSQFRQQQTQLGGEVTADDKEALRAALRPLEDELNQYLASEYGVDPRKKKPYADWLISHKPFHWFVEFYGIMKRGGFDVIIGNPPYVEYSSIKGEYRIRGYATERCDNLYCLVLERCQAVRERTSRLGLIIPVSFASSNAHLPARELLASWQGNTWLSHFSNRPGQLFSGAQNRLTILLSDSPQAARCEFGTRYMRWNGGQGERDALFSVLEYTPARPTNSHGSLAKTGSFIATQVLEKSEAPAAVANWLVSASDHRVYWVRVPGYFCQFFTTPPMARPWNGGPERIRGEVKSLTFAASDHASVAHATLNSSTFYHRFYAYSDGRHINPGDVYSFPFDISAFKATTVARLSGLSADLAECMRSHTGHWRKSGLLIDTVDSGPCKPIMDEIDCVLAKHYGFTDEELDFIINYDIKYRMGGAVGAESAD